MNGLEKANKDLLERIEDQKRKEQGTFDKEEEDTNRESSAPRFTFPEELVIENAFLRTQPLVEDE